MHELDFYNIKISFYKIMLILILHIFIIILLILYYCNINNFEDDDDDIEEVFDTLMDNDNLDFDRTKYDKVLLDNINTNFDFINLYEKESFELINCQFAIHYFNISLFAKLINLFLKQNGLFIYFMEKNSFKHYLEMMNQNWFFLVY